MKVLVINLARARERWENFNVCNSHILKDVERVEAVDGNLIVDKWQYLAPLIRVMHESNKFNVRAAAACFISHIHCAQIIVDRKLPFALICEDDAEALPAVERFLQEFECHPLPFDWVRLHAHREGQRDSYHRSVNLSFGGMDLVVDMDGSKSNAAYILTNAGARKVIGMQRMIAPVDHLEWYHGTQGVVFVQTRRNLFRIAKNLSSDISPNRGRISARWPHMIRVSLVRRLVGRAMLRSNFSEACAMARAF